MNRKQIKENAKELVSQNRGYYFKLTFIPAIMQYIVIAMVCASFFGLTSNSLDLSMDPVQSIRKFYLIATATWLVIIVVALIKTWFDFSMKMIMLKSYRKDSKPKTGKEAILYVFKDKKWLYVIGLLVLIGIYNNIVSWVKDTLTDLVDALSEAAKSMVHNDALAIAIIGIALLVYLVIYIVALLFTNVTDQMAYTYSDSYEIGEGVFYAFKKAYVLMTKKENMFEFFILQLSLLGWYLLNILTLGILGICWFNAYAEMVYAGFYDEITKKEE